MSALYEKRRHLFVILTLTLATATSAASDVSFYPSAETAAAAHCDGTQYPELCLSTLATIPDLHKKSLPEVISHTCNRTETDVTAMSSNCSSYFRGRSLTARDSVALSDCMELLDTTMDDLRATISDLQQPDSRPTMDHCTTVLSAGITNQQTCLEGFSYQKGGDVRSYMEPGIRHIARMVSNSLAMTKKLSGAAAPSPSTSSVREERQPFTGYGQMVKGFPRWVKAGDRRLLQAAASGINANAVVAKDGSGAYTTVSAAVAAAPTNSKSRYVIYIKAGAYMENVEVGKNQKNLMFIGDGIGKTVIKASRNVVDGSTTFRSATVAVVGNNFLARDLTIENSAGPSKHQAVALRVGADLSAFYRCSFVGYQDTLYVHSLRQFFRECDIYGTIDFVFGNSAVVLQSCNLYARRPLASQSNIYTAQGRTDPNQNTGTSLQRCRVVPAADLAPVAEAFPTFLGRPWKAYSRTVYMQSYLGGHVDPRGWLEWDGDFALKTLFYGEYDNEGPGAGTGGRVRWPGYRVITDRSVAVQFTVGQFIQGAYWLNGTGVAYDEGL